MKLFFKIICFVLCMVVFCVFVGCNKSNDRLEIKTTAETISDDLENVKNIVETNYFTMTVPSQWNNHFNYTVEIIERDIFSIIINIDSQIAGEKAYKFSVEMVSMGKDSEFIEMVENNEIEPVVMVTVDEVSSYFFYVRYIGDGEITTEEYQEVEQLLADLEKCLSVAKAKESVKIEEWNDDILKELKLKFDDTPYVAYSFGMLGKSFQAYKNRVGGVFYSDLKDEWLNFYLLNKKEGVSYCRSSEGIILAVEDDEIVAVAFSPTSSSRFGSWATTPTVRETIEYQDLPELFGVTPKIYSVGNSEGFYMWKGDNGYIGIKGVGSFDPQWVYYNTAVAVVLYSDYSFCTLYN